MSRFIRFALASLAAVSFALAADAQTVKKETADFLVTGEVTAIDVAGKTITVKGVNDDGGSYAINDATTIMSGNQKIALDKLQKGSRVALNGDNATGKNVATYIEVVEGPASK